MSAPTNAQRALIRSLSGEWGYLLDQFFEKVEREARRQGVEYADVRYALFVGFGDDVADAWDEWGDE